MSFPGALYIFLNIHPSIRKPHGEVHFFNVEEDYQKGVEYYRKSMPYTTPEETTIEKSPNYLECPECAQRIHEFNSSIKLILIVRDPTDRLVSEYLHHKARHRFVRYENIDYIYSV